MGTPISIANAANSQVIGTAAVQRFLSQDVIFLNSKYIGASG